MCTAVLLLLQICLFFMDAFRDVSVLELDVLGPVGLGPGGAVCVISLL